jgi:UPF0716 protein FxsA
MVLLAFIALIALEVVALIEVAHAIGWLLALVVLFGTSLLGRQALRIEARAASRHVSEALAAHRAPGRAALHGVLGFLGGVLLLVPGFITDAFGVLLLLPPTRSLAERSVLHRFAGRLTQFATVTGRFTPGARFTPRPADVDSTAVDDDLDQLGR